MSAVSDRTPAVTLVLPSFGSGGAERVVLNLAGALVADGAEVRLVVLDATGPLAQAVPAGVEVVPLGRPRARWAGPALVRALRARPSDLVIGSQTHLNVLLAGLRPLLPARTRLVLREPSLAPERDRPTASARLVGRALGRADVVIATSGPMQTHLARVLRGPARLTLLPNPVDVDGLRDGVDPSAPSEPHAVLTVGRLVAGKGHDDLLDALAQATDTTLTLHVIGDGPLRPALEDRVRRLGIAERVRFHGHVEDRPRLATLVATSRALVHPSLAEGMPNAVLESLAVGTPVLATTDLPTLADLADEVGPTALRLVPRAGLARALDELPAASGPAPRPSLLPVRFRRDRVAQALVALALGGDRADAEERP